MLKSEYDQIIREHFDLSDAHTRQYIATLEDAGQEQLLAALSSALYDQIVAKVDEIDFGTIPLSRGDITKVQGFANTEKCLDIIRQLVIEYKQDPEIVDVVISAIANIKDRTALFVKAYALNSEFCMLLYNLMVLSIERSVSLMIATCIQYVKDPNSTTTKAALDKVGYKKTMDDTLYKQLITFNNLCKTKTLDKLLQESLKHPVKEDVEFRFDPDANPIPTVDEPHDIPGDNNEEITDGDPFDNEEDFPEDNHDDYGNPVVSLPDEPEDTVDPDDEDIPGIDVIDIHADKDDDDELPIDIEDQVEVTPSSDNDPDDAIMTADRPISEDEFMQEMDIVTASKTARDIFKNAPAGAKKAMGAAAGVATVIGLAKLVPFAITKIIIPLIRNCIFTFYYSKARFSDYLNSQADFIDANANDIESGVSGEDLSDSRKKKVIEKQRKTAERLRKWANFFSIDKKKTNNEVDKANKEEEKKKKKVEENEDGEDVLF